MFKKLDSHRCFVSLQGGKLCRCAILADGGVDMTFGQLNWTEVKGPVDQDFLNAANQALGTNFSKNDIEGAPRIKSQIP